MAFNGHRNFLWSVSTDKMMDASIGRTRMCARVDVASSPAASIALDDSFDDGHPPPDKGRRLRCVRISMTDDGVASSSYVYYCTDDENDDDNARRDMDECADELEERVPQNAENPPDDPTPRASENTEKHPDDPDE